MDLKARIRDSASELYDYLYDAGQRVLDRTNPCQIRADGTCYALRLPRTGTSLIWQQPGVMCCANCEHHTPTGCSVKALACKLWICHELREAYPELDWDLRQLLRTAAIANIPTLIRCSKEESFRT